MLLGKSEIANWFRSDIKPTMSHGDAMEAYHRQHPSKVFLRSLPLNAVVADIGAGDGSITIFKRWPSPARPDLKIFAYSLEKGSHFNELDGYEIGDWNVSKPFNGKTFDAINCAHFIEHVKDPKSFIRWARVHLTAGGRVYLEWPSDRSLLCPSQYDLVQIGFERITCNYHDDQTHLYRIPSRAAMIRSLKRAGFVIESTGTISMPLIADELLAIYRDTKDSVALQQAYWLKTNWSQYIVAVLPKNAKENSSAINMTKSLLKKVPGLRPIIRFARSRLSL